MREEIKNILNAINKAENIVILPHVSMDGDCLGSTLGLAQALRKIHKNTIIIADSEIPGFLGFLPAKELLKVYDQTEVKADLCIAVDCGDEGRFEDRSFIFKNAKETVNIDHHSTNNGYAKYNFVDVNRASSAELVFELITEMGIELDKDIATCLYVGVSTDTGGFRFGNTKPETHLVAAELVGYGLDVAGISQNVFNNTTLSVLKLTARALDSLALFYDGQLAVVKLSARDLSECGYAKGDTEGLVEYGRSLPGVKVSVSMREEAEGVVRVSMRSNGETDVSRVAGTFGGGGHRNASGCTLNEELAVAFEKLVEAFKGQL